jgi:hypothetical protein
MMAKTLTDDFHRIPGANRIALSPELAEEIKNRFDVVRVNKFQIFLLAAGLRKKYLNKKTNEYAPEFQGWYKKNKMDALFGQLPNFTKYASAGDVIDYVDRHTSNPEKYLKQLPTSMGALYELSLMLSDKNGKDAFSICLHFTPKRKLLDEPKSEWSTQRPALIRSNTTEAMVRNWRRNWNNPPPPKVKRSDKRTLPFLTITVSGELFDFDKKTGDKIGCVDLAEVETMLAKINKLFTEENAAQFRIAETPAVKPGTKGAVQQPAMEYLTEGYFRRKEAADPARNIK